MLLEIGRIVRVHGLNGEVVVDLTTNVDQRLAPGTLLYTDAEGVGSLLVETSRPHQHRWLVRFASVADRSAAEALGRPALYAEPVDDPDAVWVHELFDMVVVDSDGEERGRVVPADHVNGDTHCGLVPIGSDPELRHRNDQPGTDIPGFLARAVVLLGLPGERAHRRLRALDGVMRTAAAGTPGARGMGGMHGSIPL